MSSELCKQIYRLRRSSAKNTGYCVKEACGLKMLKPQASLDFSLIFSGIGPLFCHSRSDRLHCDGALQTFALHIAAKAVRFFYVAIDKQIGCGASPAAIESCPAILTVRPGIDVQPGKLSGQLHVKAVVVQITQLVFLIAHKLVAGIDISIRGDSHVFTSRTASPHPLDDARSLGQIYIEVEEVHIIPLQ